MGNNIRKLSKAEEKRKKLYEDKKNKLLAQGYEEKDLTIGIAYANIMAIVLGMPIIIFYYDFIWWRGYDNFIEIIEI